MTCAYRCGTPRWSACRRALPPLWSDDLHGARLGTQALHERGKGQRAEANVLDREALHLPPVGFHHKLTGVRIVLLSNCPFQRGWDQFKA